MGTRSCTIFRDAGVDLACLRCSSDGYPDGHGKLLAQWLQGMTLINGIAGSDRLSSSAANGIGCLAAQAFVHFKDRIGCVYAESPNYTKYIDYTYVVSGDTLRPDAGVKLQVFSGSVRGDLLWEGPPSEFDADKIQKIEEGL